MPHSRTSLGSLGLWGLWGSWGRIGIVGMAALLSGSGLATAMDATSARQAAPAALSLPQPAFMPLARPWSEQAPDLLGPVPHLPAALSAPSAPPPDGVAVMVSPMDATTPESGTPVMITAEPVAPEPVAPEAASLAPFPPAAVSPPLDEPEIVFLSPIPDTGSDTGLDTGPDADVMAADRAVFPFFPLPEPAMLESAMPEIAAPEIAAPEFQAPFPTGIRPVEPSEVPAMIPENQSFWTPEPELENPMAFAPENLMPEDLMAMPESFPIMPDSDNVVPAPDSAFAAPLGVVPWLQVAQTPATAAADPAGKLALPPLQPLKALMWTQVGTLIRDKPSLAGKRIASVAPRQRVEISGITADGQWVRVSRNGVFKGYMARGFLVEQPPGREPRANAAAPPPAAVPTGTAPSSPDTLQKPPRKPKPVPRRPAAEPEASATPPSLRFPSPASTAGGKVLPRPPESVLPRGETRPGADGRCPPGMNRLHLTDGSPICIQM